MNYMKPQAGFEPGYSAYKANTHTIRPQHQLVEGKLLTAMILKPFLNFNDSEIGDAFVY